MKLLKKKIALTLTACMIVTNVTVSLAEPVSDNGIEISSFVSENFVSDNEIEVAVVEEESAAEGDTYTLLGADAGAATPSTPEPQVEITTWAQLQEMITAAGTAQRTVKLTKPLSAEVSDAALYIGDGQDITVDLNGFQLDRGLYDGPETEPAVHGSVFEVRGGGKLTLTDTAGGGCLTGGAGDENGTGGGVSVEDGAVFVMKEGRIMKNAAQERGGAVYVEAGGAFTFEGGEIINGSSKKGGAVYCAGSITMTGGTISYSEATYGGCVYIDESGTLKMTGGTIIGGMSSLSGGCIYNGGKLTVTGGTVSSGISYGNGDIDGGGCVYISDGAEALLSGGTIEYGSALDGGGICNNGNLTMTGGQLTGNEAVAGGGIVNNQGGVFTMSGGTITGNQFKILGGGVLNEGTFRMSGSPVVTGNSDSAGGTDNIYLAKNTVIIFDDSISGGAMGVLTDDEPDFDGNRVKFAEGSVERAMPYLTSDAGYGIVAENGALYLCERFRIEKETGSAVYGDGPDSSGVTYYMDGIMIPEDAVIVWTDGKAPSAYTVTIADGKMCLKPCNAAGTAFSDAGTWSFRMKIGDTESENKTEFTVAPREADVVWGSGTLSYNGRAQAPNASVGNKLTGDNVEVIVSGQQTASGTGYTATATGLSGDDSGNYTLPDPRPVKSFSIVRSNDADDDSDSSSGTGHSGPSYSEFWYMDETGTWRIQNRAGQPITGAWVCDDSVSSNGRNVWYLIDAAGNMVTAGLVQDNTGNFYSLEAEHNGYFGMLRYQDGYYNCSGQSVYLSFNRQHNGSFGAITNEAGLEKLKAIYGVTQYGIGNENSVYTATF